MPKMPRLMTIGALLGALLLSPLVAEAKPPKKPRKPKPGTQQNQPSPEGQQGEPQKPAEQPAPPQVSEADRLLWEYKTSQARSVLQAVAGQADQNGPVSAALGRVSEQEKNYGEAESRLRKATELSPSDPASWVYLGEVYLRQRKGGEADAAFRKATEAARSKGGGESSYYLGVAQQRLRQYDEAISTLSGASAPDPALIPYQIGVTRSFQENWQAALDQLNRAIEMNSRLAYAYYYRGLVQEKLGRKDQLVGDMENFLSLAPDAPEAERAKAILRAVKR